MKTGTVLKTTGSLYKVREQNGALVKCKIKGLLRLKEFRTTNPAVVGDEVLFSMLPDGEGLIEEIKERRNYIIRKSIKLSSQKHILAANVDQVVLIVTLSHPKTHLEFIDRFLITAEAYHIPAILLFNKIDLYTEKLISTMEDLVALYSKIGYKCLSCAAISEKKNEEIRKLFLNKTTLVAGHSGVGKSTLINALAPSLNLKTASISKYHKSGKHTTTYAEMFDLPGLGSIIDTPGIKGLGVLDIPLEEISHYFLEMRKVLPNCKYHNCVHLEEPECAVKSGIEYGSIAASRYRSYRSIYSEEEGNSYRTPDYE